MRSARCVFLTVAALLVAPAAGVAAPTWLTPAATVSPSIAALPVAPVVASNARGDTVVAWQDPVTGKVVASERPVGGAFTVGVPPSDNTDEFLGNVAIDDAGQMYVWLIRNNSNNVTATAVVAQKPIGAGTWTVKTLDGPNSVLAPGSMILGAVTPSGKALTVWFQANTNGAQNSKLMFSVKAAGSDTWSTKLQIPNVSGNTFAHALAMNAAGQAALVWQKLGCNGYQLSGATMSAANVWTNGDAISLCNGQPSDVTSDGVGIDANGTATAGFTHTANGHTVAQFSSKPIASASWPDAPHTGANDLTALDQDVSQATVAVAADGTTTIAWVHGSAIEERTRAAAGGGFAPLTTIPATLTAPNAPELAVGSNGTTALVFNATNAQAKSVVGAARRAPGAATFAAMPSVPGVDNTSGGIAVDDQGNVPGAWLHSTNGGGPYTVQASGLDAVGPAISNVTFPATADPGTAFSYGATLSDRWSLPSGTWAFGDGTTGPLSGSKTYAAAGAFTATLTATDAFGNATTLDRAITVGTPPPGGGGGGGGTTTGTTPPPPPPDTIKPVVLSASMSPATFAVDAKGSAEAVVAAAKKGTTLRFNLSEAARVRVLVEHRQSGRRVGKRCVKPTRANRRKRACTRFVKQGAFAVTGVAGPNSKRFSGKIGTRTLKPGRYRATLTATDAAGNVSKAKTLSFRVVRR